MSNDDELEKIFDGNDQEAHAEPDPNGDQKPSSSKCDETIAIDDADDKHSSSFPIGSSTLEGAMKRKPGAGADGVNGTKRVRIIEPQSEAVDDFVEQLVCMGYDRAKVAMLFRSLGRNTDLNAMLDALTQQQDAAVADDGEVERERGGRTSPFIEPFQHTNDDILEGIEGMDDMPNLSSQKASPSFIDICDEPTLRKFLNANVKHPATEESRVFVVNTAMMMAQRLSQVSYVSKVARLAELIFSFHSGLYRHFKDRTPSEPSSDMIDRHGIMRENDAPFGVLIDVAEAFVNNDGLKYIAERIRDPAASIRDIGSLCSILADFSWMTFPGSLDGVMEEAAETMRAMMKEYSEKEIRDEKIRREIFEAARKVCKGMTPGTTTSPRYEFIERLMLCGNMEAKKNAIDELASICDHDMGESCSVRRWMKRRNVLAILLSDHLDHPEYVQKIGPILRKLAPVLSEREFRTVWCLQRGRGGISNDTFSLLLANLATGFQDDQIVMLFTYLKKHLHQMTTMQQQNNFIRMIDVLLLVLNRQQLRPPIHASDRQLFIECSIRLLDRIIMTNPGMSLVYYGTNYGNKVVELFRGLPVGAIVYGVGKLAREISRMKELDRRFPFYFTLIHHILAQMKVDMPQECAAVSQLLFHHKFAERITRLLMSMGRFTLGEVDRLDQLARLQDEMLRARVAHIRQQQQQSAPAAAAIAAASAASSLQPSPAVSAAGAAVAPPPSAVTPISNGPSPKRDGSPAGSSSQASPEGPSTSNLHLSCAADAAKDVESSKENEEERKEETVSVCTPPCTPEPLRVSTARLGSKEWDKELGELANRVNILVTELSFRLVQYTQLVLFWQDTTMAEESLPGCHLHQLPQRVLEEMFGVLIESSKNSIHKRVVQATPYWALVPHAHNMHNVIKRMVKTLEHRPVFRSFVTRMCTMSADLINPLYVELVRTMAEMCFASPKYNTSTDWLEEILRFLWTLATSKMSDVRERAVEVLKQILCERYYSLQLIAIYAIARFNEAIDNFNRFSGRDALPHWQAMEKEVNEEMEEEENGKMAMNEGHGGQTENAEQAVDLSLEPKEKRARAQSICKESVERMMRRMRIEQGSKTREEAELHLSRTISFVRRIITYGYLEAKCPSSLVVRDRAIPGEMCELTLKLFGPVSAQNITVFMTANEPVNVFAERVRNLLPPSPPAFRMHWPRGYRVRHYSSTIQWDRGWSSVGDQMSLNSRGGIDDCQIIICSSPFNEDFATEAQVRKGEPNSDGRVRLDEPYMSTLGYIANETKLVPVLHSILNGMVSSHLQESVMHCVQQLPLQSLKEDEGCMEVCNGALSLQNPHQALHHLITLLAALLPPNLSGIEAILAKKKLEFIVEAGFIPRFMAMIREVDVVSERLSLETLALFHEVCLTLIRLFFLKDSGKHRAHKANENRLPLEVMPLDTSLICDSLTEDDMPQLLRALIHFTWAIVAPRRIDVERELSVIVTNPSVRLQLAKEKRVDNPLSHRRTQLARTCITTIIDIAGRYGEWERNVTTLFNPTTIDGITVSFWRDMLMHVTSIDIQRETRILLSSLMEPSSSEEEDAPPVRRIMMRLVFELGRNVWGPTAALKYSAGGRDPVELLRLAEKVVRLTRRAEMDEELLDQWIDLQIGFFNEERPLWNSRCHMSLHLSLLQELLKKQDRELMAKSIRHCLQPLFAQALFPFAVGMSDMMERNEDEDFVQREITAPFSCGLLPSSKPIGCGLAEGDVRKKYMEIVIFYVQEFPEKVPMLLEWITRMVSEQVQLRRCTIAWWEKAERIRRQRAESCNSPQMNLAQRLHNLVGLRETDVRMVKGLLNPSYMCYANSVLQQLVFMPGVCETLYAIGDTEREFGDLTDDEDIKNSCLLRSIQTLFSGMLFSADSALSADGVLNNIELPSGGSVREQQDCVEFFLTLIDKCDSAAEKLCRPPVFKRFMEGVMGYEYACKTCKHRHRGADESFTALNLEIHGTTVLDSLDHFMDGALLEGASAAMCDQCGEKRTTLRIGALRRAPTTLCIQLKRFSTYDSNGGKLNIKVDVPRELDLTRFSEAARRATDERVDKMFGWFDDTQDEPVLFTPPPDCPVRWRYRLVGVIVHSGQLGNGHYTSYVKERRPVMRGRPWFDQWLLANDDRVSVQEDKLNMEWQGNGEENTPSAYLLWYEMIEDDVVSTINESTVAVEEATAVDEEDTVAVEDMEDTTEATGAEEKNMEAAGDNVAPVEEMAAGDTVPFGDTVIFGAENLAPQLATVEKMEPDTVAENGSGLRDLEALERETKRRAECEWMDIGLGSLGVLEGPLLSLWKCVPDRVRGAIVSDNINKQLGRDVLTESYAKLLLQMMEVAREHYKRRPLEEKFPVYRKILRIARLFSTEVLWRTHPNFFADSEATINLYRLFIVNVISEHTDLCKEWLLAFYDPVSQAISEETRELTTSQHTLRTAISAWWLLASHAVVALRGDQPALVEAYCSYMVECLRLNFIRIDGFFHFFVQTADNPHCLEFHIKHNILPLLVNAMFYYNKRTMAWGVQGELTQRVFVPLYMGLCALFKNAIERDLINEDEYKEFVETRLHLAMAPLVRHGDQYLSRMVNLITVTLRTFGEGDDSWIGRITQAILTCLKIDPHRANGVFFVVASVGKQLIPDRSRDFYDEILGKRETEAAENGLIIPGVVVMLENMLADRREYRHIQLVELAVLRMIDTVPLFRECANAYAHRLDAIKIRAAEWKEEEPEFRASISKTMLMGAEAIGMLPLDACGPISRPSGSNEREYDMMQISDDDLEDEDEEMISEDDYSDEGPVNLSNNHRR